jgi:hypothetical protein
VRGSLVGTLAEEKQALAGFRSPCNNVVGNIGSLIMLEGAHSLGVNGIGTEPEELLGVEEVPVRVELETALSLQCAELIHVLTWGSWSPCARGGLPRQA